MAGHREKFQELLREMFQFDCSDLDFGIYRIMNFKREAVERFIEKDLPETIAKELSTAVLASQSEIADQLNDVAAKIREALGEPALDGEGALAEQFHETPLGQRYLDLQSRASGAATRPALEAGIFNKLHAFFWRYYDAGDFLSKRRYSRKEKYAIPYNGEEVCLHWANSDQYYVKTGEYFTDYRFKAPNGVTVHFRLQQADVPQNNVKGDKRFFIALPEDMRFDANAKELVIPFEFRPLNEAEQTRYGQRNQQEGIIAEALQTIPARLQDEDAALLAISAPHHRTADGTEASFLAHHLRQYTQKNTSDFFIHKDLRAFLTRELDFYLKNEVLNLDELQGAGEIRAEGWFQIMGVIKAIGGHIIDFLAQIEDFQKKLFEKRKFITETQYCITVGNIPEDFYADIAACESQWAEWKELLHVDEQQTDLFTNGKSRKDKRVAFLKAHPTLVLDTKYFATDFVDRLLAAFDDLDEVTDGVLVHSENFQALSLLMEKYREKIKCIYIDPPYNTGSDDFLYKDGYQASSWASMLVDRARLARSALARDGLFLVQIGDEEGARSRLILDLVFPERKNTVVVRRGVKNVQAQFSDISRLTGGHDVIHVYAKVPGLRIPHLRQAHEVEKPGKWDTFWRGIDRHTMRYELFGQHPDTGQWRWEEGRARKAASQYDYFMKHEASSKSLDEWYIENLQAGVDLDFVRLNDEDVVQYYVPPQGHRLVSDNWLDISSAGTFTDFPTEKSLELLTRVTCWNTESADFVLDFFAGSGSTGHAAIQAPGGLRKFILIEMGDYFDTVLLPRIKRVTFAAEWKQLKPTGQGREEDSQRCPRIVKYMRLESYEDALDNITFRAEGKTLYDFDDYVVCYMLDWETKESDTLLNIKQLARPFTYKLRIRQNQHSPEKPVDIPETFAYLLGMYVTTRHTCANGDCRYVVYRGRIDHREIAVIWRETAGWEKKDYERDRRFVASQKLAEGADEVFVNGDSLIPKARTLDGLFKSRMFGGL